CKATNSLASVLRLSAGWRKSILDPKIAVLRPSPFFKSLAESGNPCFAFRIIFGEGYQHTDAPNTIRLLRVRRERPRRRCAAEERNELAALHSITSSARTRKDSAIVRPIAFAVLRLMTSSNLVGSSTGRSAGLVPFKILST